jgi:AcrR family transcriptional regulator
MPVATVRTPRSAWVDAGLRALATGGPEAIRVEVLADTLGVTKGGFYWHYAGRPAFLAEMLDAWERTVVDDVITIVEGKPDGPREKLQRLFDLAASVELDVELAVREWARRDADVAARVHRIDNRRTDYLRSLFEQFCPDQDDVEARCLLAFSLFIGSNFVATEHRGRTRAEVLHLAFDRLLIGADA